MKKFLIFLSLIKDNGKINIFNMISLFSGLILIACLYIFNYLSVKNIFILFIISIFFLPFFIKNVKLLIFLNVFLIFSFTPLLFRNIDKIIYILSFLSLFIFFIEGKWSRLNWSNVHTFLFFYSLIVVFSLLFTIDYTNMSSNIKYFIRNIIVFFIISELIIYGYKKFGFNIVHITVNAILFGCIFSTIFTIYIFLKYKTFLMFTGIRQSGWIGDANVMAMILNICFCLTYFLFTQKIKLIFKLFYFFVMMIISFGIIISLSRGGLLGFSLTMLIIIFKNRKVKSMWLLITFLIISFLLFWGNMLIARLQTLSEIGSVSDFSLYSRLKLLNIALKIISKSPLFGVGFGDFIRTGEQYYSTGQILNPVAHNAWLHVASETGLFGLFFFIGIFISSWKILQKAKQICINNNQINNKKILEGLQWGILSIIVPITFLSEHNGLFLFLYWGLCTGISISLLKYSGGKNARC